LTKFEKKLTLCLESLSGFLHFANNVCSKTAKHWSSNSRQQTG